MVIESDGNFIEESRLCHSYNQKDKSNQKNYNTMIRYSHSVVMSGRAQQADQRQGLAPLVMNDTDMLCWCCKRSLTVMDHRVLLVWYILLPV